MSKKFVSLTGDDCCTETTPTCDTTITLTDAPCSSAKFVNIPACETSTQECRPSIHVNYTPPQETACAPTNSELVGFLCTLLTTLNGSTDSEITTLCDPDTGAPVIVRYKFSFVNGTQTTIPEDAWNIDGSVYTGDVAQLTSCAGGTSSGSIIAEYFICDNGTQKIVQLCGTNCNNLIVSYLLLDRTTSTEPADWGLVTLGECAGAGMEVTQGTDPWLIEGAVTVGNFPVTQNVDGTVDIGNFPATQPVSGTVAVSNFPASQTVDGTVNVGNFPVTQPVSGTVAVSNFPATQPVSGTVSATQGTSPWIITGSLTPVSIANFPADPATSTLQATGNDSLSSIDTKASYLSLIYDILLSGVNSILNAVNYPSYVDRSLQRTRGTVIVESGTVTTVTTVTTVATVTNVAQLATYQAQLPVLDLSRTSWAVNVRGRFT